MTPEQLMIAQMAANLTGGLSNTKDGPNVGLSALSSGLSTGAAGFALGGPIGGAVGLLGGGIAGAIGAEKEKAAIEEQQQRLQNMQSSMKLANYPTNGVSSPITYYRKGGIMRKYANGGIERIGAGGMKAHGPSHEGGGVKIGEGVEVEGNETGYSTPDYDVWFSNDLKTPDGVSFSEAAERLLRMKEDYESKLNSKSPSVRNTAMRNLEKLNMELQKLTNQQMSEQEKRGIPVEGEVESGTGIRMAQNGATFSRIAPYLDNVVNTALTAATPAIPSPELQGPIDLDTDYNIDDALEGERRGLNQIRRNVEQNVSSSAVARNNMLAAAASSLGRQNQLFGDKERMETNLENQERQINYQTDARNLAAVNATNQQRAARQDQMLSNYSAIASNAVDDFITQETEDRLRNRDLATMELLKKKYQDLGIWDRATEQGFEEFLAGRISYEDFIGIGRRKPMPQFKPITTKGGISSTRSLPANNIMTTPQRLPSRRSMLSMPIRPLR